MDLYGLNSQPINEQLSIYENAIYRVADEYAESLVSDYMPPDRVQERLSTFKGFRGLLNYEYIRLFKPTASNPKHRRDQYTTMVNSVLDYNDIDLLDSIFDVYVSLCAKYNQLPSVLNFCTMTGLTYQTVKSWLDGAVRFPDVVGSGNVGTRSEDTEDDAPYIYSSPIYHSPVGTRTHKEVVKRWLNISEGSQYDNASSGNVGGIFILKSAFGYRETAPVQIEESAGRPRLSKAEILALSGPSDDADQLPDF